MRLVYIVCPYSHHNKAIRHRRVAVATEYAASLVMKGYNVISPLTHSVPIADKIGNDDGLWVDRDIVFLSISDEIHILTIDGWKKSKSIRKEIEFAKKQNIPIFHVNPKE